MDTKSSTTEDNVIVVTEATLKHSAKYGSIISDPRLPVDLLVKEYLTNAKLVDGVSAKTNPANAGFGVQYVVAEEKPNPGVDMSNARDIPAAYIDFISKESGKSLGIYLVTPRCRNGLFMLILST